MNLKIFIALTVITFALSAHSNKKKSNLTKGNSTSRSKAPMGFGKKFEFPEFGDNMFKNVMEDMKKEEKSFGNFGNISKLMNMKMGKMSKVMNNIKKLNKMKKSGIKNFKGKKGNLMHMESHIMTGTHVMTKGKNGKNHLKGVVNSVKMVKDSKNGKLKSKCNSDTKYFKDGKLVKDVPKGCKKILKKNHAKIHSKPKRNHVKKGSKNLKKSTKKSQTKKNKKHYKKAKNLTKKSSKKTQKSNKKTHMKTDPALKQSRRLKDEFDNQISEASDETQMETDPALEESRRLKDEFDNQISEASGKTQMKTDPALKQSRRLKDEFDNHMSEASDDKMDKKLKNSNKKNKNSSYMHSESHVMSSVSSSSTGKNGKTKSHGEVKTANMMHENKNGKKNSKCNSTDKHYKNGKVMGDKLGSHNCKKVEKNANLKPLTSRQ